MTPKKLSNPGLQPPRLQFMFAPLICATGLIGGGTVALLATLLLPFALLVIYQLPPVDA